VAPDAAQAPEVLQQAQEMAEDLVSRIYADYDQWVADGGLECKQKWEQWQEKMEKESNASCSTASTVMQQRSLTDAEEKEARKHEKVLREIAKIEERVANGEKVDTLQLQKIKRREEIQATLVMTKVQAGYLRYSA